MDACDVLIVGGGPAGSSCAWKLRDSGLDVAILDRRAFPRNKVCGGWITPAVLEELEINPAQYARTRVLQPITGFQTSYLGGPVVETHYGAPVSYGIRRCEFDDFLVKRSGARILPPAELTHLERGRDGWIVNRQLRSRMLVGAGGTFCPVARFLGAKVSQEVVVAAQEAEFEMDSRQRAACRIRGEVPELYFSSDMKGYGWCFRKQNFLNVGLGRLDPNNLATHSAEFLAFLKKSGKLPADLSPALLGHAYLLFENTRREVAADRVLLIGDAAGVAYEQSGEGIRPAIESGLLAAAVIAEARGCYSLDRLERYGALMTARFGKPANRWIARAGRHLPNGLVTSAARRLMTTHWFARKVVLNDWFLRSQQPAIGSALIQ